MKNKEKIIKISVTALFCAIGYAMTAIGRIPVVLFLDFDPKDAIIVMGGFALGPMAALVMSVITSLLELITFSETGLIGFIMNTLSTAAFACTAAFIYKKKHTLQGALIGLICGTLLMTGLMILWNYFITPYYMGYPREEVAAMLVPVFLPFNLIKATLNSALAMLIYKPLMKIIKNANVIPQITSYQDKSVKRINTAGVTIVSLLLIISCTFIILIWKGII
ncbi:MAG: ECF transporter S component [Clostridia bacterium]